MKKRENTALRALMLAACLFLYGCFSGCSSFPAFDAKTLMAPPKANEDQQAIYKLLQGTRQDVTFIYPKSGQYRSAIIMEDFTGNGTEDAIGFYALEDGGGVEVQFLTKEQGVWRTASTFRNTALQVDRVCLGDLTGQGVNSVLIGWGSAAGATGRTASVNAYIWNGTEMTEYPLGVYGEMALSDLNGDGISEVFTVDKFVPAENEGEESSPAQARVFAWQDGTMAEAYTADADNSITSYSAAASGRLSATLPGVVLDGVKADGSLTTQVFYLQDGTLINAPAGVNTEAYVNPFARPASAAFLSRDINGDGYLEIPKVTQLPCIPADVVPDSTSYLVEWTAFRTVSEGRLAAAALMNSVEGYWFRLPSVLKGHITSSNDSSHRIVTYTGVITEEETGEQLLGPALFSIRAFTRSAWESRGAVVGYEPLASQNDTVYGILVHTDSTDMLSYIQQIKDSFQLLGE